MNSTDTLTQSIFFTLPFVIFCTSLLILALLFNQHDATLFFLVLLFLYILIRFWGRLSLRKMACDSEVDRCKLFPGERLSVLTRVANNKLLPVLVRLQLQSGPFLHDGIQNAKIVKQCGLLGMQGADFKHTLTAEKRGVYRTARTMLITADLFGIFPKSKTVPSTTKITVFPRLVAINPIPLLQRIMFGKPGAASPVADPIYILGTKAYRGDRPARHIHWKASARLSRLQEKQFEPAEQDKVLLVLDGHAFAAEEKHDDFENAIEVLAAFATWLDAQGYAVGFATNCRLVDADETDDLLLRSPITLPVLLTRLAETTIQCKREMKAFVHRFQPIPRETCCVYFSYAPYPLKTLLTHQPAVNICCRGQVEGSQRESVGDWHLLSDFKLE